MTDRYGYDDGTIRYWYGRDNKGITLGENNRTSTLTEAQVREIKFNRQDEKSSVLAQEFNVTAGTIRSIRAKRTWGHVKQ